MRTISSALKTHLASGATTLASCWQITRTDGEVFRFTDHDANIVVTTPAEVAGTYLSAVGYAGTEIANSADLAVDNLDVAAILDSSSITEADLSAGLYDHAEVRLFALNWADPSMGIVKLRRGWLGEVSIENGMFTAELRGMLQALQNNLGETTSPTCRAELGDTRCGVSLAAYTVAGTVTASSGRQGFADSGRAEADDYFVGGKLTWTGGANSGRSMEVRSFAGGVFGLFGAMPDTISAGDTYSVHPGCDKRLATCRDTYSNVINFRGEPYLPGNDEMLRGPE